MSGRKSVKWSPYDDLKSLKSGAEVVSGQASKREFKPRAFDQKQIPHPELYRIVSEDLPRS
jgi:hypothetical protein